MYITTVLCIVGCHVLSDPDFGSVAVTGNNVGNIATYTCDAGFKLIGNAKRVCTASGWLPSEPVCVCKSNAV